MRKRACLGGYRPVGMLEFLGQSVIYSPGCTRADYGAQPAARRLRCLKARGSGVNNVWNCWLYRPEKSITSPA